MADTASGNNHDMSSSSEKSPTLSTKALDQEREEDSVDPAQDALVGEKSLDDRFNESQLRVLVSKKDEYRAATGKQRKELALKTGEAFAKEMSNAGIRMSESDRAGLYDVSMPLAQCAGVSADPMFTNLYPECQAMVFLESQNTKGADSVEYSLEWETSILQGGGAPYQGDPEASV